jgi:hypothetical protein
VTYVYLLSGSNFQPKKDFHHTIKTADLGFFSLESLSLLVNLILAHLLSFSLFKE